MYLYSSGHSFGSFLVWTNWDMFGSSESSHNPQPEWRSSTDGISIKQMAHSTATPRHCDKPGLVRTSNGHLSTKNNTLLKFKEHHRTAETEDPSSEDPLKFRKLWVKTNCQVQVSVLWLSVEKLTEMSNLHRPIVPSRLGCSPRDPPDAKHTCRIGFLHSTGPDRGHARGTHRILALKAAPKRQSSNEPVRCIVEHIIEKFHGTVAVLNNNNRRIYIYINYIR